ncbi:MAG: gfo/Idh/MocA family oxidoreductase [Deltaproteobacteria bacterium]|nr:MAG: gfo/Idh/MocA family oxidoreductase [Deltaproteobacteria bacterium]
MKNDPLRVGVVGVGHLGQYHVEKYTKIPGVELVGVADTNLERAREIAERFGTRPFGSHRELLGRVDALSLAVPTETHFDVARDILSNRIHLLIEKPITYCIEDADSLLDLALRNGVKLQVGLVERFNPAVVKMESLLSRPVFMESHRMNEFTTRGIDVDVVLDLMIHDLDIFLHLIPSSVREVHAVGMSVITDKTDIANARMIFEDGTVTNLTVSRISHKTLRKIRVFQPDAYFSVDCARRELSIIRLCGEANALDQGLEFTSRKLTFPGTDPLADEISSFVHAVRNGSDPVVSGRDGRNALAIALEIIHQIERGCNNFSTIC